MTAMTSSRSAGPSSPSSWPCAAPPATTPAAASRSSGPSECPSPPASSRTSPASWYRPSPSRGTRAGIRHRAHPHSQGRGGHPGLELPANAHHKDDLQVHAQPQGGGSFCNRGSPSPAPRPRPSSITIKCLRPPSVPTTTGHPPTTCHPSTNAAAGPTGCQALESHQAGRAQTPMLRASRSRTRPAKKTR